MGLLSNEERPPSSAMSVMTKRWGRKVRSTFEMRALYEATFWFVSKDAYEHAASGVMWIVLYERNRMAFIEYPQGSKARGSNKAPGHKVRIPDLSVCSLEIRLAASAFDSSGRCASY